MRRKQVGGFKRGEHVFDYRANLFYPKTSTWSSPTVFPGPGVLQLLCCELILCLNASVEIQTGAMKTTHCSALDNRS